MKKIILSWYLITFTAISVIGQGDSSRFFFNAQLVPSAFTTNSYGIKIKEANFSATTGVRLFPRFYTGLKFNYYYYSWARAGAVKTEGVRNENIYSVFFRYYLFQKKDFWFYSQIQYGHGSGKDIQEGIEEDFNLKLEQYGLGIGLSYFITQRVSMDFGYNYDFQNVDFLSMQRNNYKVNHKRKINSFMLGFSWFFIKSKK